MHKTIQTRLYNRIPVGHGDQVLVQHRHRRHVAAELGVVGLRQGAARVHQDREACRWREGYFWTDINFNKYENNFQQKKVK